MLLVGKDAVVKSINPQGKKLSGNAKDALRDFTLTGDILNCVNSFKMGGCGKDIDCSHCHINSSIQQSLRSKASVYEKQVPLTIMSGGKEELREYLVSTTPIHANEEDQVLITLVDITERHRANQKINKLNRSLLVLSSITQAIIESKTAQELFDNACNIAVEDG
jgi:hypothetical protein